jgi:hypothetical protein
VLTVEHAQPDVAHVTIELGPRKRNVKLRPFSLELFDKPVEASADGAGVDSIIVG